MNTLNRDIIILIADDDMDDRAMIKDAFEVNKLANRLYFVKDGEELLDFLGNQGRFANIKNYPRPGLILLDLNMPIIDGREALKNIKRDPLLCNIPVIVLSTSEADEEICTTYALGVNSFITKPVSFDALVEIIGTFSQYWLKVVALPPSKY